MSNDLVNLGFENKSVAIQGQDGTVSESRAVAEVQAAFVIAKKFPRDENAAVGKILKACDRPFLAEQSTYAYPRGGELVTGPSIRLAEAIAQYWGNIDCGVREISQADGVSVAEAYAIDLETNVRVRKTFHVPHVRETKKGKQRLTSSRDIYELVANQGARRLRACILGVIPGDVTEAAEAQCKETLLRQSVVENLPKLLKAFEEFSITKELIEKRLGHNIESIIPQEVVTLRGIYKSIKDGMADRSQFFDIASTSSESARDQLMDVVGKTKKELDNDKQPGTDS